MLDPSSPALEKARTGTVVAGTLHGVGLGPGDPELLTVRAVRLIQSSPVLAYFAKAGRRGNARAIVDQWIAEGTEEMPLLYPVTTEIHFADDGYVSALSGFYAEAAERIAEKLAGGQDVALVCEGDPMFYGSFMHLFTRLKDRFEVSITAGVSGMSGCWAAAGQPMTWGDDILTVLPGTLDLEALTERLRQTDAAVIMKLGSNFPKVREAIRAAGLLERAIYVERGTMAGETIVPLIAKTDDKAPYFSMILIPGEGRRP
ncbi:Precorrin-2 C(20)-methyltransferase [Hartmannibacter diazotrophicus]|uniref:Precorrin-2 C(20)-methyltransferase n=1 Tax=Hartmannibacter diazotrophicus TaxID=1482074 RepID=A0A2C9DA31_9HYPH|nr:precorrin-2 C(20)-methyltransferase [Hartmannibacter diazotrophicus]SON56601.1 Precorrin-2 C(20)-methyltransferase [Hartmannibacter diazotrophicus]